MNPLQPISHSSVLKLLKQASLEGLIYVVLRALKTILFLRKLNFLRQGLMRQVYKALFREIQSYYEQKHLQPDLELKYFQLSELGVLLAFKNEKLLSEKFEYYCKKHKKILPDGYRYKGFLALLCSGKL